MNEDAMLAFWRARLDEREAQARLAQVGDERSDFVDAAVDIEPLLFDDEGEFDLPARVLREIEADRELLAEFQRTQGGTHWALYGLGLLFAIKRRVAVYSDHPDYDPAWQADGNEQRRGPAR